MQFITDGKFTNKKRHLLWINNSAVTFKYYVVVKTTLKQNKGLAAKFSKKRKLFNFNWLTDLGCMNSPNELTEIDKYIKRYIWIQI